MNVISNCFSALRACGKCCRLWACAVVALVKVHCVEGLQLSISLRSIPSRVSVSVLPRVGLILVVVWLGVESHKKVTIGLIIDYIVVQLQFVGGSDREKKELPCAKMLAVRIDCTR